MLPTIPYLTPDAYLAQERAAETKSEYLAGEVYPMGGVSRVHSLIVTNLAYLLSQQLWDRPCSAYMSNLRVRNGPRTQYSYPDVMATCGKEEFEDDAQDILLNPVVVIEVLSPATEAYDRGLKFEYYRQISSLVEYILVRQAPYRVEQYIRHEGRRWDYLEYHEATDVLVLHAIGCQLSIADIYHKVATADNAAGEVPTDEGMP